jgi:hypothetical protein
MFEQPFLIEEEEVPRFDIDDDSWWTYLIDDYNREIRGIQFCT